MNAKNTRVRDLENRAYFGNSSNYHDATNAAKLR